MALTKIEVSGYRGFRKTGTLDIAVPNGTLGSGLTVITGPNNAGKSSVLECLKARGSREVSFNAGARNPATEAVQINYHVNGQIEAINSVSKGSSEVIKGTIDHTLRIFILPSRRAFSAYFGKGSWSRDDYVKNSGFSSNRKNTLDSFEYRLFYILKDPASFNKLLTEALGYTPTWTIDESEQGQHFLKFFNGLFPF